MTHRSILSVTYLPMPVCPHAMKFAFKKQVEILFTIMLTGKANDKTSLRRFNKMITRIVAVEFHGDAIVLSGETGTKLKCEILGEYYPLWWSITSGGSQRNHNLATAMIELNAGTGEDYVDDTGETMLGSSGHALQLKLENSNASKLKVVLVEENDECYKHLKNVIRKRWPGVNIKEAEGPQDSNKTGIT